ncbi:uncharacterized protein [Atheta coriaria]|uniref:uncharacterized protein n=1 Tax=Dalotia coriaria TaxID=877792 RepID=UPI0031F41CDD
MVTTFAWTHSWIAVSISVSVLLVLLAFLFICLCYNTDHATDQQRYYVLDEHGIKRMPGPANLRPNFGFSKGGLILLAKNSGPPDRQFLDSLDFDKQFTNSVLQIDACAKQPGGEDDDWKSCISEGATRRNSMVSVISAVSDPGQFMSKPTIHMV